MKFFRFGSLLLAALCTFLPAGRASAQTGNLSILNGVIDFSGAASATKLFKAVTSLPGTCSTQSLWWRTSDNTVWYCSATNTFTQFGSSGGSGTVNPGTTGQIGYYASSGTAISPLPIVPVPFGGTGAVTLGNGLPLFGAGTAPIAIGSLSGNTTKLATSTGALTPGDCVSIDAGGNYIDSGVAGCGGSGAGKGGIVVYSAASLTLTGTQYIPIGGGGLPSGTETSVDTSAPSAATVTNFDVQMSSAPGLGNNIVFTWRKNASSQALTCTISGAVATSCNDSTHSFLVAQGDLLTIQIVSTGVIAGTPNLVISTQFGTTGSNGTVNTATQFQVGEYLANGTAISGVSIPNCLDSGGQHVNFNSSTGVYTCGTTGPTVTQTHNVTLLFNGGGSALSTGSLGLYPGNGALTGTINRVDISGAGAAGATCSITINVWKANAAIPTSANIISASAPATLSSANLAQNGSISGWSTSVAANDVWSGTVATNTGCITALVQVWYQ